MGRSGCPAFRVLKPGAFRFWVFALRAGGSGFRVPRVSCFETWGFLGLVRIVAFGGRVKEEGFLTLFGMTGTHRKTWHKTGIADFKFENFGICTGRWAGPASEEAGYTIAMTGHRE